MSHILSHLAWHSDWQLISEAYLIQFSFNLITNSKSWHGSSGQIINNPATNHFSELFSNQKKSEIWRWSNCNWTRTQSVDSLIVCGFTLKRVRDMTRRYSQMHPTDKYLEHSSIIWPVWPNGWVFVEELSGSGFESSCSYFTFRFRACFEEGVPSHSGNYRVWIDSETRKWHDKNIQSS